MVSPYDIYRGGSDLRKDALGALWPELAEELAGTVAKMIAERVVYCASVRHADIPLEARPAAIARVELNGGPACRDCIADRSRRPGGYPLALTHPKDIR